MTSAGAVAQLTDLAGRPVVVAGLGITGQSASTLLVSQGALVTAVDSRDDAERREVAGRLAKAGVAVRLGPEQLGPGAAVPPGTGLVVTSPGLRPDTPLLAGAAGAGIEVIGDVELAWRLRPTLAGGRSGLPSPAPTARPPRSGCWPRCSRLPAIAASRPGTWVPRSWTW